jgi:hypothetical protein
MFNQVQRKSEQTEVRKTDRQGTGPKAFFVTLTLIIQKVFVDKKDFFILKRKRELGKSFRRLF